MSFVNTTVKLSCLYILFVYIFLNQVKCKKGPCGPKAAYTLRWRGMQRATSNMSRETNQYFQMGPYTLK
jgi:hypothetical protein